MYGYMKRRNGFVYNPIEWEYACRMLYGGGGIYKKKILWHYTTTKRDI